MTKLFTINTPEYQEAQEKFYEANVIGQYNIERRQE